MLQELKFQLSTAVLTVLTVAAAISAGINFSQQLLFRLPDDGVTWVDHAKPGSGTSVEARRVIPDSGAGNAGLRAGDILLKINGLNIEKALFVPQALVRIGVWNKANYLVERGGVQFKTSVIVEAVPRDPVVTYQYLVGLGYLIIGLFVYFRRGSAQKALHFYVLCLVSFVFFAFHYTGQLNGFDEVILFGNVAAGLFAPTLFLHFCLTFPEPRPWLRSKLRVALLYVPAIVLMMVYVGFSSGMLRVDLPLVQVREMFDRAWMLFLTTAYLVGAVALSVEHNKADDPTVRQQLKWLRNGAFSGILPFAVFYVLPYCLGIIPNAYMKMSVLSLTLVPLTLAYAIVRYRLMDVDILFRRGYAYTLATLCVLAGFYGIVFSLASLAQRHFQDLGTGGLVAVMLMAAFLFQPVRNWIQERLDRYFYRDRYDYRQTLVEFARELSSETDLDAMLSAVAERLRHTLYIRHLAFFLSDENSEENAPRFYLKMGVGLKDRQGRPIVSGDDLISVSQSSRAQRRRRKPRIPLPVFRSHTIPGGCGLPRHAGFRAADHLRPRPYLLPALHRARTHHRVPGREPHRRWRLSLQRGRGAAADALRLCRHRHRERAALSFAAAQGGGERAAQGVQREYCRVDQRRHPGGRPGRSRRELEHASGAVDRNPPRESPGPHAGRVASGRSGGAAHACARRKRHSSHLQVRSAAHGHARRLYKRLQWERRRRPHGPKESTLNIAIAPLISKNMEQIGRLIIFDDVTDRAELERRLVQADKLSSIGLLAAGVAHEVNTPLAVISTYAQMLAKQVAGDEQKSKLLEKIAKQTFRASEIVNSLLNFSRTSTTEFGEVSVNRVIQETLSLLEHQMQKAGLEVLTALDTTAPTIAGNPGKLQQVFLNLFINARDAMTSGGVLEVKTSHEDDGGVQIDVLDSGHGIDPEHIHRIYDPFFTTKGARKGTGLGLSVTYGIIQEHGGAIKVFSRPGGGTRFHLEFPPVTAKSRKQATV